MYGQCIPDPTVKAKFATKCNYTEPRSDLKELYWSNVAEYPDLPFPCAFDMHRKTHRIKGNIFMKSERVLSGCEFNKVQTEVNGNCGADAFIKAITSDKTYLAKYVLHRDKEQKKYPLPVTVRDLRNWLPFYVLKECSEEQQKQLLFTLDDERRRMDMDETETREVRRIGIYEKLCIALTEINNEDKEKRRDARRTVLDLLPSNDVWFDDTIFSFLSLVYRVMILCVFNTDTSDDDHDGSLYLSEATKGQKTMRTFWPYRAAVHSIFKGFNSKSTVRYMILNCQGRLHYEVFFSNFTRKGLFTFKQIANSPTVSCVFRNIIPHLVQDRVEDIRRKEARKEAREMAKAAIRTNRKGEKLAGI